MSTVLSSQVGGSEPVAHVRVQHDRDTETTTIVVLVPLSYDLLAELGTAIVTSFCATAHDLVVDFTEVDQVPAVTAGLLNCACRLAIRHTGNLRVRGVSRSEAEMLRADGLDTRVVIESPPDGAG